MLRVDMSHGNAAAAPSLLSLSWRSDLDMLMVHKYSPNLTNPTVSS